MVDVEVQVAVDDLQLPSDADIVAWAKAQFDDQECGELTVRIVGEEEATELNTTYRQVAHATNVLSFPAGWSVEEGSKYYGDIAICSAVVRREAQEQQKNLQAHWAHMVTHGVLHLLGYDHQTEEEAQEMEAREVALLKKFGFDNPYQ